MDILSKEQLYELITTESRYRMSKELGISQNTLSNYANKVTPIGKMSLDNAIKLTAYAKKLQSEA
ncbi:helix-turn-helix domain-containing protein [Aerococcus sanguinicola]|uniref:XRE family transcriptional regulator n=1 Tax=Aerococcus sanguinicola TaxID=119206 RepID=A0A0X8F9P0_9LACT|nr:MULTISPECIES: hypothetical protein [Aerococcus]AMB93347.1 hypothetical protein AWM72_00465 [Aerococcus sanguinicola]OFT92170.1 hypothetical protein HMPREF3090_09375 [Aerococcus sp. HMSC23C02]PKZ23046.1 XRE family transcriptional regulator [Aerococcus sanguinicola]